MPRILPRLRRLRKGYEGAGSRPRAPDRLSDLDGVRENPGDLRARFYIPERLERPAPLVVVLHGCTQDAALYDHGSGWSTLADRHGFALLFPEQRRSNNPMLCFNWFSAGDTRRGTGEAASIAAMIGAMKQAHDIDPDRVFITGLSAGGAMASVMLATYPELFAAGAILAGVAYGCADSVGEAFDCMGGRTRLDSAELALSVRRASPHKGPWPRVQVWQGSSDRTVVPSNADAIALQWAGLHGLGSRPDRLDEVDGHPRKAWVDDAGRPVVEQYTVRGMAHGVPLDGGAEDPLGSAGAHMLDVGLSSTARIAGFFKIAPDVEKCKPPARAPRVRAQPGRAPAAGPQAVIEKALRAAGLMR